METARTLALPLALIVVMTTLCADAPAAGVSASDRFKSDIAPILANHCFDCHADGANKGNVAFDEPRLAQALAADRELWWKVLKNVRAGLMPPAKKPRLSPDEINALERWVKRDAF